MFSSFAAQGYSIKSTHVTQLADGGMIAHVTISVQTGTVKQENGFYPSQICELSLFGKLASVGVNYVRKGSLVTFQGVFRGVETFQREDGSIATTVKVDVSQLQLPPKGHTEEAPAAAAQPAAQPAKAKAAKATKPESAPEGCDF